MHSTSVKMKRNRRVKCKIRNFDLVLSGDSDWAKCDIRYLSFHLFLCYSSKSEISANGDLYGTHLLI